MYLRIIGTIEFYKETYIILLKHFQIIKNHNQELTFHKALKENQNSFKKTNLFFTLNEINSKNIYKIDKNPDNSTYINSQSENNSKNNSQNSNIFSNKKTDLNLSTEEINKNYFVKKKKFRQYVPCFS